MTRRTLGDARRTLEEDMLPGLSDYWGVQLKAQLTAAEARAKQHADSFVSDRQTEVLATRDAVLRELTDVRDGYDDLANQAAMGRITATDYSARLRTLRQRQAGAEDALGRAEESVEVVAAIEEDPLGWYDDVSRRMPSMLTDFAW